MFESCTVHTVTGSQMPAASFGFIGRRSGPLPLMFSELQAKHFGFGSRDLRTDPCVCVLNWKASRQIFGFTLA